MATQRQHELAEEAKAAATAPEAEASFASARRQALSAQSPIHLFKTDFLRGQKALGIVLNPADANTWLKIRAGFEQLSAERKASYQFQSRATVGVAQMARADAAAQGRLLAEAAAAASAGVCVCQWPCWRRCSSARGPLRVRRLLGGAAAASHATS